MRPLDLPATLRDRFGKIAACRVPSYDSLTPVDAKAKPFPAVKLEAFEDEHSG